jgi:hypothetical protein
VSERPKSTGAEQQVLLKKREFYAWLRIKRHRCGPGNLDYWTVKG